MYRGESGVEDEGDRICRLRVEDGGRGGVAVGKSGHFVTLTGGLVPTLAPVATIDTVGTGPPSSRLIRSAMAECRVDQVREGCGRG